jgi:hypothetical protein
MTWHGGDLLLSSMWYTYIIGVGVDPLSLTPPYERQWKGYTPVDTKIRAKGVNSCQENATTASSN